MSWVEELAGEISGEILHDAAALEGAASDFGRVVMRKPRAVVRPASAEDVSTAAYLSQVLARFPPQALVGGHILLWPALGSASHAPLFMRPPGDFLMGVGILPAVPPKFLPEVLPRMALASQGSILMGGKRYLSGWLDFDAGAWKAHFGDHWLAIKEAKRKFDPKNILNPEFVKFDMAQP